MSTYQVESFIEGKMEEGKSGTLSELVEETRRTNPLIMAGFPNKRGSAKGLMNWVLNGDVSDNTIRLRDDNGF